MARNLYILAGTLLLFALFCFGMTFVGDRFQQGLPGNGMLWKTTALFLTLGGLIVAFLGVMTAMFEQVDRRAREREMRARQRRK
jgi:uncharacterized membrane protein